MWGAACPVSAARPVSYQMHPSASYPPSPFSSVEWGTVASARDEGPSEATGCLLAGRPPDRTRAVATPPPSETPLLTSPPEGHLPSLCPLRDPPFFPGRRRHVRTHNTFLCDFFPKSSLTFSFIASGFRVKPAEPTSARGPQKRGPLFLPVPLPPSLSLTLRPPARLEFILV